MKKQKKHALKEELALWLMESVLLENTLIFILRMERKSVIAQVEHFPVLKKGIGMAYVQLKGPMK